MKKVTIHSQRGFTFLELSIVIAVLTAIVITAVPYLSSLTEEKVERYAFNGLSAVAQAAKAHYVDEGETWYKTWPASVTVLVTRGYLPNFTNQNGAGGTYTITAAGGGGINIATSMETAAGAISLATQWGPMASVAGGTVTVGVVVPGAESSHLELADRAGLRSIQGTVEYETNANIDLQGDSQIIDAERIDARIPSGLGAVDANAINGDEVTADGFRYN